MCCETLPRTALKQLYHDSQATFFIPIFRAPTTTSTAPTITTTLATAAATTTTIITNKILSAMLQPDRKSMDFTAPILSDTVSHRTFENLILTNTVVAAFCIVLMVTLTGFLFFLLVPSIRRRWLNEKSNEESKPNDSSKLNRQQSLQHFTLGPSRLNPLFESSAPGTSATATQFGTLFQPHATATTLLHPTIWTSMTPATVVSTPIPSQQTQLSQSTASMDKTKPTTTSTGALQAHHSSTTLPKPPRKR